MFFNLLEDSAQPGSNPMTTIIFVVLIVAFIGLIVFQTISGKKKQKEAKNMVSALKKGDRVKTIGGICGFVYEINDAENTFVLETGTEDVKSLIKFDKAAIYQTAPAEGYANVSTENKPESVTEATAPSEPFAETVEAPVDTATEEATSEEKPAKKERKKREEGI